MTPCSRGCKHYRRHIKPCRAEDRADGAWAPAALDPRDLDLICDADNHQRLPTHRHQVWIGKYGGLETWQACNGCKPRDAKHGTLCEGCHLRLAGWFKGQQHDHTWTPAEASIAWAYDWLAADREPRQATAGLDKIMQGKKVPPAALALYVHDLRQDIATILGTWLGMVTYELNLDGPPWWRHRVTEAQRRAGDVIYRPEWGQAPRPGWRSFLPQTQAEITDAQRYLAGWLGKVETVPDLVASIYDTAADVMVRVASNAPWRAEPRKLRGIPCPECERDALAIFEGDNCVTCRRCSAVFSEDRYDIWTEVLKSERERVAS